MQENLGNQKNNMSEAAEQTDVYKINKKTIFLISIFAFLSLFFGFIFNFSVEDKIMNLVYDGLRKNRSCPIYYQSASLSYFLPGINLKEIDISSRCLNSRSGLLVSEADISLGLPSIAPMGLTFNTEINKIAGLDNQINLKSIHNFSTQYVKVENTVISFDALAPLMNNFKLDGTINLNALVSTDLKAIKDLDIYLTSKDFTIPTQVIQSFELPTLAINNLSFKAHSEDGGAVEIQELIIGDSNSPIRANASGTITLDKRNIRNSRLDIEAQVKFTPEFIESFAIINLLLGNGTPDEQGFYHMKIDGTLGRPNTPKMIKR
ncbi:type II secretion system protein GspN [Halobacteriovorax sp. CON-3]|uniref:type II secretion system protein GspN n=1 Tax=Halobacteriovorax sp. CON-3 TaxID=3157710 RepID=UPI003710109C